MVAPAAAAAAPAAAKGIASWVGPAIIGGSSILGSAIGAGSGGSQFDYNAWAVQQERQKYVAKYGLSWVAQGAKRAGIHPLAALGHQLTAPTGTPMTRSSQIDPGQFTKSGMAIADYIQRQKLVDAEIKLKHAQALNLTGQPDAHKAQQGSVALLSNEDVKRRYDNREHNPGFGRQYEGTDLMWTGNTGTPMISSEASEAYEGMGEVLSPLLIGYEIIKSGAKWLVQNEKKLEKNRSKILANWPTHPKYWIQMNLNTGRFKRTFKNSGSPKPKSVWVGGKSGRWSYPY